MIAMVKIQNSSRMSAMRTVVLPGLTISFVVIKISTIKILDKLPSSDHLPMQMTLAIDYNNVIDFTINSCFGDKMIDNVLEFNNALLKYM